MAENKTRPTRASVEAYLDAIEDEERREDCRTLGRLMTKVSKHEPVMWGPGIVGFGTYHYKYESGREGDSCLAGFASRKGDISVYLMADFPRRAELLAKLGRHKVSKGCLYLRRLSDIDLKILEQLVAASIAGVKRRYGYQTKAPSRGKPEARTRRSTGSSRVTGRPARRSTE